MKIQVTTQQLLSMEQEIQGMYGTIFQYWFNSRINEFYKHNGARLDTIKKKRQKINDEYLYKNEKGQLEFEGEGQNKKPKLKDSNLQKEYDDKVFELFNELVTADL